MHCGVMVTGYNQGDWDRLLKLSNATNRIQIHLIWRNEVPIDLERL